MLKSSRRQLWFVFLGAVLLILLGGLALGRYRVAGFGRAAAPAPATLRSTTRIADRDGMPQVYVPAGWFWMGSDPVDARASEDELPRRRVFLDAFWIDRTEVTHAMYVEFLNKRGNGWEGGDTWFDADDPAARIVQESGRWEALPAYADHPVVEVTWYGARAYCRWAGRRLPTEAEWEKAARGVEGRIYPWGEGREEVVQVPCGWANLAGCFFDTRPADAYEDHASPYGALNMSGNIAESVADWYRADYYQQAPDRNPPGPSSGEYKVLRGGSWTMSYLEARAASRFYSDPSFACLHHGEGFRCAASP